MARIYGDIDSVGLSDINGVIIKNRYILTNYTSDMNSSLLSFLTYNKEHNIRSEIHMIYYDARRFHVEEFNEFIEFIEDNFKITYSNLTIHIHTLGFYRAIDIKGPYVGFPDNLEIYINEDEESLIFIEPGKYKKSFEVRPVDESIVIKLTGIGRSLFDPEDVNICKDYILKSYDSKNIRHQQKIEKHNDAPRHR